MTIPIQFGMINVQPFVLTIDNSKILLIWPILLQLRYVYTVYGIVVSFLNIPYVSYHLEAGFILGPFYICRIYINQ